MTHDQDLVWWDDQHRHWDDDLPRYDPEPDDDDDDDDDDPDDPDPVFFDDPGR